jgi:hypothetical protein
MYYSKPLFVVFIFLFAGLKPIHSQNLIDSISCQTALQSMLASIEALNTAKFKLISIERVDGEMLTSSATGVVQYVPRKLFYRSFDAEDELMFEILYLQDENNNNALISPNGFPYINLNLDPLGSTIRKNKHLTILDAGGLFLVDMIKLGMTKYSNKIGDFNRFSMTKETETTTKLVIDNLDYAFTTYTVKEEDTFRSICLQLGVPEYKIIELNEDIDSYADLEEGQTIKIPSLYARKFEVIIRNQDYIPLVVRIFDDQGLFSEYYYEYFESNPTVNNQTFNRNNPAYTF